MFWLAETRDVLFLANRKRREMFGGQNDVNWLRERPDMIDDGSFIMIKATGELIWLREQNGNYMLDVWVPPPDKPMEMHGTAMSILLPGSHDPGDES